MSTANFACSLNGSTSGPRVVMFVLNAFPATDMSSFASLTPWSPKYLSQSQALNTSRLLLSRICTLFITSSRSCEDHHPPDCNPEHQKLNCSLPQCQYHPPVGKHSHKPCPGLPNVCAQGVAVGTCQNAKSLSPAIKTQLIGLKMCGHVITTSRHEAPWVI
jgi:hypothetical protein